MDQKAEYLKYLKTDHWNLLRLSALQRDGVRCCKCRGTQILQVHHKVYRKSWLETQLEDLITLCNSCHFKEHFRPDGTQIIVQSVPVKKKKKGGHPTAWYMKQDIRIRACLKRKAKARKRFNRMMARKQRFAWRF